MRPGRTPGVFLRLDFAHSGYTRTGSKWPARASSACSGATRPRARSSICSATRRLRRPLQRRGQRRPHRRRRRQDLQALAAADRRPPAERHLGHRQRRRRLPAAVPRRGRPTRQGPASTCRSSWSSATTPTSSSPTTWKRSGSPRASSEGKIGTTGRGIGPCYQDKVGRRFGIRVGELLHPDHLRERLRADRAVQEPADDRVRQRPRRRRSRRSTPNAVADEYLGYAARMQAVRRPTRRDCCRTRSRPASASCSRPPRAACSTSTTAPTRT